MITSKHFSQFSWWGWRTPTLCITMICFVVAAYCPLLRAEEKIPDVTGVVTSLYDLILDGDDIGDISITRMRHDDGENSLYTREENISSKVSSSLGVWEMKLAGKTVVNNNSIVSFDYKVTENKQNWRIFGERHDSELWCAARRILTKNEKDEEDILAISFMVAAETVPYVGEAFTALELLIADDDREGEIRIPLSSFDTTSSQLASFLMSKPNGFKKEKIKVLNTAELKIETVKFEEMSQEKFELSGQNFTCRVFKSTKSKGGAIYWIAEGELGAFLVKESGNDDDGPYEVILKNTISGKKRSDGR